MLRYETGDAAGQNMTSVCSWAAATWVRKNAPKELGINIRYYNIEGEAAGPVLNNTVLCTFIKFSSRHYSLYLYMSNKKT